MHTNTLTKYYFKGKEIKYKNIEIFINKNTMPTICYEPPVIFSKNKVNM